MWNVKPILPAHRGCAMNSSAATNICARQENFGNPYGAGCQPFFGYMSTGAESDTMNWAHKHHSNWLTQKLPTKRKLLSTSLVEIWGIPEDICNKSTLVSWKHATNYSNLTVHNNVAGSFPCRPVTSPSSLDRRQSAVLCCPWLGKLVKCAETLCNQWRVCLNFKDTALFCGALCVVVRK